MQSHYRVTSTESRPSGSRTESDGAQHGAKHEKVCIIMDLAHFCLHALARYVVTCTESRFPGLDVRATLVNQHERRLRVVGLGGLVEGRGARGNALCVHVRARREKKPRHLEADFLFLKHACSILRQSANSVCGAWTSSLWTKQHRAYPVSSLGL